MISLQEYWLVVENIEQADVKEVFLLIGSHDTDRHHFLSQGNCVFDQEVGGMEISQRLLFSDFRDDLCSELFAFAVVPTPADLFERVETEVGRR